jgi:hypothetical protein
MAFGVGLVQIAGGTGHGQSGSGHLDVSTYADKARVIGVSGASDSCSGFLTIVAGDERPLDTLVGKASIVSAALGVVLITAVALRARG